jgi:peptide deformylase
MLKIITYPNPILREKAQPVVSPTDPSIKKLITDMTETMRAHDGLGLAAPQIGHSLQICVIEIQDELFVLINPEIKSTGGDLITQEEGCLSFPGKYLPIERSERVKVRALDANGQRQIIRARGLLSRALQHEIDHLNGVLLVDRGQEASEASLESPANQQEPIISKTEK